MTFRRFTKLVGTQVRVMGSKGWVGDLGAVCRWNQSALKADWIEGLEDSRPLASGWNTGWEERFRETGRR